MKACVKNLKHLSWLAVDALEPRQAEALRAHVAECPGCRHYLDEISEVAGKLSASNSMPSDLETSSTFHRRLVQRIEQENQANLGARLLSFLPVAIFNWRIALPVAGITVGVTALLLTFGPWPKPQPPMRVVASVVVAAKPTKEMTPTFGDYRMLANRSLDALDQELSREARTSSFPSSPVYTVSSSVRAISTD